MLTAWAAKDVRIKLHQNIVDTADERFAVKVDGEMKAYARSLCSSDWCWQQDIDEVVHEDDAPKIKGLAANLPKAIHLVALPVIEYWGDKGKVRVDVILLLVILVLGAGVILNLFLKELHQKQPSDAGTHSGGGQLQQRCQACTRDLAGSGSTASVGAKRARAECPFYQLW